MKKESSVFILAFICSCLFVAFSANAQTFQIGTRNFDGGKWVPEYGGAAQPFRCVCTSSFTCNQCRVGDITSNVSLCE